MLSIPCFACYKDGRHGHWRRTVTERARSGMDDPSSDTRVFLADTRLELSANNVLKLEQITLRSSLIDHGPRQYVVYMAIMAGGRIVVAPLVAYLFPTLTCIVEALSLGFSRTFLRAYHHRKASLESAHPPHSLSPLLTVARRRPR